MADEARGKIAERVRGLLAMADSPGATVGERQAFAAKAAELLARHDLTEAIVRAADGKNADDPVGMWVHAVTGRGGHGKARVAGIAAVCSAYGCPSVVTGNDARSGTRWLKVIGARSDLKALAVLVPSIAVQMEVAAAAAAKRHVAQFRQVPWEATASELRTERNAYFRSYIRGYGSGVADLIRTRRHVVVDELTAAHTGAALVLVDRSQKIEAEYKRRFPKLGKAREEKNYSYLAAADGYEAGTHANLGDPGITATTGRASTAA